MCECCYIVHEREFIKSNQNIYKIGKTTQENIKRFKQYPKGSYLIMQIKVNNCDIFERHIMQLFNKKYIRRIDIGLEYYQGNEQTMMQDFINLWQLQININNNDNFIDTINCNNVINILNTTNITNNTQNIIDAKKIINDVNNLFLIDYKNCKLNKTDLDLILENINPILCAIEKIYCNDKYITQHSVLITDLNRNKIQVYENNNWTIKHKKNEIIYMFADIVKKIECEIINIDSVKTINFDNEKNNYLTNIDNMVNQANNMFYNNCKMIMKTKKQNELNTLKIKLKNK